MHARNDEVDRQRLLLLPTWVIYPSSCPSMTGEICDTAPALDIRLQMTSR